jgi:hypothetical protein
LLTLRACKMHERTGNRNSPKPASGVCQSRDHRTPHRAPRTRQQSRVHARRSRRVPWLRRVGRTTNYGSSKPAQAEARRRDSAPQAWLCLAASCLPSCRACRGREERLSGVDHASRENLPCVCRGGVSSPNPPGPGASFDQPGKAAWSALAFRFHCV